MRPWKDPCSLYLSFLFPQDFHNYSGKGEELFKKSLLCTISEGLVVPCDVEASRVFCGKNTSALPLRPKRQFCHKVGKFIVTCWALNKDKWKAQAILCEWVYDMGKTFPYKISVVLDSIMVNPAKAASGETTL